VNGGGMSSKASSDSDPWSTIVISDFDGIKLSACNLADSLLLFSVLLKRRTNRGRACVGNIYMNEHAETECA
jgi:hypothetical protein